MIQPDMGGQSEDRRRPPPALPADLTSIAVALATKAHGEIPIFEKMSRTGFRRQLVAINKITLCGSAPGDHQRPDRPTARVIDSPTSGPGWRC